jgi:hypothetical protein
LFTPTNVARLLRAAPKLETLDTLNVSATWVQADESSLLHPALNELVHRSLQRIRVPMLSFTTPLPTNCITRLRQHHFPRLKEFMIDRYKHYHVTPLEPPSLFTSTSFFDASKFREFRCCRAALQCFVLFFIVVVFLLLLS